MKLEIKKSENTKIFITSDTHYNHKNICSGETEWDSSRHVRTFQTVTEMNDLIVNSINSVVGENDILFHLGDWSFGGIEYIIEFRNRIKCKNVHLILGNHDQHILNNKDDIRNIFSSVHDGICELSLSINNGKHIEKTRHRIVLCHYPIHSWHKMDSGIIHLYGHTHSREVFNENTKSANVGVDGNSYEPYDLLYLIDKLSTHTIGHPIIVDDHHIPIQPIRIKYNGILNNYLGTAVSSDDEYYYAKFDFDKDKVIKVLKMNCTIL